ncbi:MAG: hypothetical protein NDJ89_06795 [Oligoflexia bacterium]|nr:hypothetical protein [Oligoflexia bacterium]
MMGLFRSRFLRAAELWVMLTGIGYAVCRHLLRSEDPYAVVNHPAQPHLQHLHVLGAPLLVFAVGWIWEEHVVGGIRRSAREPGTGRRSGWGLAALFFPLILSGTLIQVLVDESWRTNAGWMHLAFGLAWSGVFIVHGFARFRGRSRVKRRRVRSGRGPGG